MQAISVLAEKVGVNDSVPRLLHDELGIKEVSDLTSWSPHLIASLFPDIDRGSLYELGKAAAGDGDAVSKPQIEGEVAAAFEAGDEFKNGFIKQYLPAYNDTIDSQGQNGACTAFAAATMFDYYLALNGRKGARVSRAFLYIAGNETEGKQIPWWSPFGLIPYNDYGVWPDTMSRIVPNVGACLATDLGYDPNHDYYDANANPVRLKQHPNSALRITAAHYQKAKANAPRPGFKMTITGPGNPFVWVTTEIDKHLRAGLPSLYSFKTPEDLGGESGVMPRRDGDNGKGHSVLIIGKRINWSPGAGHPTGNWYIYRNSWGSSFGKNHPLPEYRQGCGVIHEHDVYWRTIQALHMSW